VKVILPQNMGNTSEKITHYSENVGPITKWASCKFDKKEKIWKQYFFTSEDRTNSIEKLITLTYNVWFETGVAFDTRCSALFDIMKQTKADIICLQEVIPRFVQKLVKETWLQDNYYISDCDGSTVGSYGVMILSKIPVNQFVEYQLNSEMERSLLTAELIINSQNIKVATVHLESLDFSAPLRKEQLQKIFPLLKDVTTSLFMGDFNFCSSWKKEQENLDPEYQDIWDVIYPSGPLGATIGPNYPSPKYPPARFDRILIRSLNQSWKCQEVQLLGDKKVGIENNRDIFPSDHLGLLGIFAFRKLETIPQVEQQN